MEDKNVAMSFEEALNAFNLTDSVVLKPDVVKRFRVSKEVYNAILQKRNAVPATERVTLGTVAGNVIADAVKADWVPFIPKSGVSTYGLKRDKSLSVNLTKDESTKLEALVKKYGFNTCDYIQFAIIWSLIKHKSFAKDEDLSSSIR